MTNDDIAPLPLFSACLPDLRKAYRVGDALEITNRAVHPQADDSTASDDEDLVSSVARDATWCKHMSTLEGAALVGEVQLLNPLDYMPHMLPMGAWLLNALIPRDELQRFARTKLRIELTMPAVAATALAPAAAELVPGVVADEAPPLVRVMATAPAAESVPVAADAPLQWWRTAYNIPELAQNIGDKLYSTGKRTSASAIAKGIEERINSIERGKGRDRTSPNWDTIRIHVPKWRKSRG